MTRHEANRILDEAFGGEGPSPIQFGGHESETMLGRITRNGSWDRRYSTNRCDVCGAPKHPRLYQTVPKQTNQDATSLREFGFAVLVITLTVIAGWFWTAILGVML